MNFLFTFSALFLLISINADVSPLVKYRDVVEKIDIDLLLKNNQLVSFYMKCLLDKQHCNKEGMLIRSNFFLYYYLHCGFVLIYFFHKNSYLLDIGIRNDRDHVL